MDVDAYMFNKKRLPRVQDVLKRVDNLKNYQKKANRFNANVEIQTLMQEINQQSIYEISNIKHKILSLQMELLNGKKEEEMRPAKDIEAIKALYLKIDRLKRIERINLKKKLHSFNKLEKNLTDLRNNALMHESSQMIETYKQKVPKIKLNYALIYSNVNKKLEFLQSIKKTLFKTDEEIRAIDHEKFVTKVNSMAEQREYEEFGHYREIPVLDAIIENIKKIGAAGVLEVTFEENTGQNNALSNESASARDAVEIAEKTRDSESKQFLLHELNPIDLKMREMMDTKQILSNQRHQIHLSAKSQEILDECQYKISSKEKRKELRNNSKKQIADEISPKIKDLITNIYPQRKKAIIPSLSYNKKRNSIADLSSLENNDNQTVDQSPSEKSQNDMASALASPSSASLSTDRSDSDRETKRKGEKASLKKRHRNLRKSKESSSLNSISSAITSNNPESFKTSNEISSIKPQNKDPRRFPALKKPNLSPILSINNTPMISREPSTLQLVPKISEKKSNSHLTKQVSEKMAKESSQEIIKVAKKSNPHPKRRLSQTNNATEVESNLNDTISASEWDSLKNCSYLRRNASSKSDYDEDIFKDVFEN